MARLKKDITFPNWIPHELQQRVRDRRERLEPDQNLEVERRLLTDPRVKKVWSLFKAKHASLSEMEEFLTVISVSHMVAQEMRVGQKTRKKINTLKRLIKEQTSALIGTVREVDEFCSGPDTMRTVLRSVLDGKNSYENHLLKVEEELIGQLESYNHNSLLRIRFFLGNADLKTILSIEKRGQPNYVEMVTGLVASFLFKKYFNTYRNALAHDVSLVASGIKSAKNDHRNQKRDRIRKLRESASKRTKKA